MHPRHRNLSELEDLKDFSGYAIDIEGNLWSLKYKYPKLRKPIWTGSDNCSYLACRVRDDKGKAKTLYIHKLVALAFLPCDDPTRRVVHKNRNRAENGIDNIHWMANIKDKQESMDFILQSSLIERIKQVHIAAQKKGIRVGDSYTFTTQMVENAVDAYIMQYGLRKVVATL